jgi:hypothetical protein
MVQKYAAAFMPARTPEPYANMQHASVEPIARVVSTAQRVRSRAEEAIACTYV